MSGLPEELLSQLAQAAENAFQKQQKAAAASDADHFAVQQKQGTSDRRTLYGGGFGLLLLIGTVAGWVMEKTEEWDSQVAASAEEKQMAIDAKVERELLRAHQVKTARQVIAVEHLIVDTAMWLGLKLDAVNYRKAREVPLPPSLDAARTRAAAHDHRTDDLFGTDPLDAWGVRKGH